MQLQGQVGIINLIQVYAPTAEKDEENKKVCNQVNEVLKNHQVNIILGGFKSKVGKGKLKDCVGPDGLGTRNDRRERLIELCCQENMVTQLLTLIEIRKIILINRRFKSGIK